jgi:hypothetical protein
MGATEVCERMYLDDLLAIMETGEGYLHSSNLNVRELVPVCVSGYPVRLYPRETVITLQGDNILGRRLRQA